MSRDNGERHGNEGSSGWCLAPRVFYYPGPVIYNGIVFSVTAITTDNGITLEYEQTGEIDNPPILLIMGLGGQLTLWPDSFCLGLAEQGYRVIRYDNRDIGLSTKMEDGKQYSITRAMLAHVLRRKIEAPYTLDDMALDAVMLLDALDLSCAHVVGASMGGMIAQTLAAQHPDRVLSLTSLMSSSNDPKLPWPKFKALRCLFGRPSTRDRDTQIRYSIKSFRMIGSPEYPYTDEELLELVSRNFDRSYYPPGVARQLLAILASGSRVPLLKHITVPTLVIHGAEDPMIPLAGGRHTATYIAGAKLKIIKGMGHDLSSALVPTLVGKISRHIQEVDAQTHLRGTTPPKSAGFQSPNSDNHAP